MLKLLRPRVELYEAWSEAHREWGPGLHEDGFGISVADDLETEQGFGEWVNRLQRASGELWWIAEDHRVLGGIALRNRDDEAASRLGHIGYGIRPSARGRGVATWALGQVLSHAAELGIDPVLAVCRDDNQGSIATLEHFDATLLETEPDGVTLIRRYAIRTHR